MQRFSRPSGRGGGESGESRPYSPAVPEFTGETRFAGGGRGISNLGPQPFGVVQPPLAASLYSASPTCPPQAAPWPCSPASDSARCENRRSGAAPCQCIVSGGILTVSPGFSTCGFSPLKQMRPTPDKQKSVCPTGWACHAVRAPGVKVTTEPPRRDGDSAVITGSWNTTPVKVSAAPRLVVRAPARMTPASTGMTLLLPAATISGRIRREGSDPTRG